MRNVNSERLTTVNVKQLLTTMKGNREEHQRIFDEAMTGYRSECITMLEKRLSEAKEGKVNLLFQLQEPQSYIEQYDLIIQMLEWTTDATIEVNMSEFNAWVRDRWHWQAGFLFSNSGYSATAMVKAQNFAS